MKLTKKELESAGLAPDLLAELLSLFDDVTTKENEIATLRAKVPTDSQKVVESVDHDKFIAATAELDALKKQIEGKLLQDQSTESECLLSAFAPFFS